MNLPELTFEQKAFAHLLHDLLAARCIGMNSKFQPPILGILWFHFTDWIEVFDLPKLVETGLLEDTGVDHAPIPEYSGRFTPHGYRITDKGDGVLVHQSAWVFDGLWTDEQIGQWQQGKNV